MCKWWSFESIAKLTNELSVLIYLGAGLCIQRQNTRSMHRQVRRIYLKSTQSFAVYPMNKINNKINQGSLLVGVVFVLKRSAAQYYLTPHAFDIYPICARKCNNSFEFEFTFSYAIYSKKKYKHRQTCSAEPNQTKPNQMNVKQVLFFSKQKLPRTF